MKARLKDMFYLLFFFNDLVEDKNMVIKGNYVKIYILNIINVIRVLKKVFRGI